MITDDKEKIQELKRRKKVYLNLIRTFNTLIKFGSRKTESLRDPTQLDETKITLSMGQIFYYHFKILVSYMHWWQRNKLSYANGC